MFTSSKFCRVTQNLKYKLISLIFGTACLGARLFIPPSLSCLIGWLIRTGDDFPRNVKEYIQDWNMLLLEKRMIEHMSTRGKLIYQDTLFGGKNFQTPTHDLVVMTLLI